MMTPASRLASFAAGVVLAGAAVAIASETAMRLPDPWLTPGAIWTQSADQACARPLPPRPDRGTWMALKLDRLRAYGIPWSARGSYELDHLVPRCLGGADVNANLWPQPWPEARIKDEAEERICRRVCEDQQADGDHALHAAQRWFEDNGWAK